MILTLFENSSFSKQQKKEFSFIKLNVEITDQQKNALQTEHAKGKVLPLLFNSIYYRPNYIWH